MYPDSDQSATTVVDLYSSEDLGYKKGIIVFYLGILTTAVCCSGVIGNVLSLFVLTRRLAGQSTTNIYLIALALADIFVLLFTISTSIKDTRKPRPDQVSWVLWKNYPIVAKMFPFCHSTVVLFQVTSVWLTVGFTLDRYLMICHPFVARRLFSLHRTKIIVCAVYLVSFMYNIPRYFEYTTQSWSLPNVYWEQDDAIGYRIDGNNESIPSLMIVWIGLTEFGHSETFKTYYHFWSWIILVVTLPFTVIAVMNVFLIREVKRTVRRSRRQTQVEIRRNDTNIMLIGIIVIFFICQVPAAVSHVLWGIPSLQHSQKMSWFLVNEVGNFLIVINSAINLLPYYFFSRQFRRQFMLLFCQLKYLKEMYSTCFQGSRWREPTKYHQNSLFLRSNGMRAPSVTMNIAEGTFQHEKFSWLVEKQHRLSSSATTFSNSRGSNSNRQRQSQLRRHDHSASTSINGRVFLSLVIDNCNHVERPARIMPKQSFSI